MSDTTEPDLHSYDTYVVAFSGGKDSLASLLHLLEEGVPFEDIELWHHDVDGREGPGLMDWPVTTDYVQSVADTLGIDVYFSWKKGGFEREMLRDGDATAPVCFETPSGEVVETGGNGGPGTRRKFPQVSGDLSVRWCSAYLKIDVAAMALRNQDRFRDSRTLVVTGERAEESASRAKYDTFEVHKADLRDGKRYTRHIDQWRPVHDWTEQEVWDIIRSWEINPHPAYHLGWGRLSCMSCIFGRYNQWASVREVAPERFEQIAQYEEEFDCTIARDESVREMAEKGEPFDLDEDLVELAMSDTYDADVLDGDWDTPQGAYGESCGPI
jgi:3'-phosphoadenosine 5'-phosphosulfate sulfotransferase (PAPS reductase)/FAD synthetase